MTLFYSWENNIPNQKNMLEKNIRNALKRLKKDDVLDMDFDRDTKNKSGAVNIADTILKKISNCSIFIADVSFVKNNWFAKNIVNQNVLFELGYAVKKLGYEKIILIFNIERGKIEDLPFDIRQLRILSFSPKKQKELENDIYASLKLIYENCDFQNKHDNWEQHDIDTLQRILSDIPKYFDKQLELALLSHRRYKCSELDYIHELGGKINDTENYLINSELRILADNLKKSFSDLGYKIASRFAPDRTDSSYQVLDRPLLNDGYQKQYYDYLNNELPVAIQNAVDAYNNLCHKRTELFGI